MVDELNQAAHALMLRQHRLGRSAVTLGEREYRVSDQVLCRRNDERLGLRNGMRGTVVRIGEESLIVRDQIGTDRRIPFPYAAEHLDYGYALTGHAAQGVTVERAFVLLHDQGALQEWGYVACSRARLETRLYFADRDTLERETPLREPDPTEPPERAARALQHSAAEPLALDRRRERPDASRRLIAQRHEQLDRQCEQASERLVAAHEKFQHLHWWNRGSRAELEAEIARHETMLRLADEKRAQLVELARRRSRMLTLSRERDESLPPLRPEPPRRRLERDPPGLGLEF